jgi:two-component system CheB/CheR fusion protein
MPTRDPPPCDPPAAASASPQSGSGACVVGIGASAGGLDAVRRFLAALPPDTGMAFIFVQHLDPAHDSMLVELLSAGTAMPVVQATDGMALEIDHLYVIPPGAYLALAAGMLHLSAPLARHGARLPFDFLLHSLAISAGARAVCVILSGTGTDGTAGLKAIKSAGGLVMVQDPDEADYDGMPRSAIAGGQADFVLPVDEIPGKIIMYRDNLPAVEPGVAAIIALLRAHTPHDFSLYKSGTLVRRIGRRMALAGLQPAQTARYIEQLKADEAERLALAEDLLINVTQFFRDPKTFDILAAAVVPELVAAAVDQPIRIWVAGCSTGEETYSLAMLFLERFSAMQAIPRLQIFASDVDAGAVATARAGLYPASIGAQVSAERLARFFTKEDEGYRIAADVRNNVVFAVQDVLADPPFSKLDLVSCRNLLIYLRPEAQAKIISVFNFALRRNGFLLLGSAETAGAQDGRFSVISKPARLYRKTAASGPGDLQFAVSAGPARIASAAPPPRLPARAADIGEFCKRLVLGTLAPAAILVNQRLECLYTSGPTERYLRVAPGYPTHELLPMIPPALRARVRAAMAQALERNARVEIQGGRAMRDGQSVAFNIDIRPAMHEGEPLLLIAFIDQPKPGRAAVAPASAALPAGVAELEGELATVRAELQTALKGLEAAAQEQNAINEEALSINEEYQSTNEELLTSKEELQSLNEELTALNSQLQETLERSRLTSNDLKNVLYSTDVATLFLDTDLNIRFFTPATRALFTLIASDVGRPLADLHSLAADQYLSRDAKAVLKHFLPIEREVRAENDDWFSRRMLPYRTHENGVAGVVITYTDITERKLIAAALEDSQRDSDRANLAKTRFLAAASHDLRQPLQTLTLLTGLLSKTVDSGPAQQLLAKLDDTARAMTGILNTLLDINQIDAGIIKAEMGSFPVGELLSRLGQEFAYIAESRRLRLRVVPCGLHIFTDPRILEQMLRNLIANALKYTTRGGVLLGCRRQGETLRIEVWDTGMGIPAPELQLIFEEYHQIDNKARERSRGLGLGLAIVQRLAGLLKHPIKVRSVHGRGSAFGIEVMICPPPAVAAPVAQVPPPVVAVHGRILVIEDDPDIRQLLNMFLTEEGHVVATARDGQSAIGLVQSGAIEPDIILADYNLPNGANGLQIVAKLREILKRPLSVIIVTGDISTETMRAIASSDCLQINKPMPLNDLNRSIQSLLAGMAPAPVADAARTSVYIVDDDAALRDAFRGVFEADGRHVEAFASCEAFLKAAVEPRNACLLVDANLPGMGGLELLKELAEKPCPLPAIMITGAGDVAMAVKAMKAGAFDFIEKPVSTERLLACVRAVFEQSRTAEKQSADRQAAAAAIATLTPRQREIMDLVLAGHPNKIIAADLGISQRTVENHRAEVMVKTGAKSVPALARLAMAAAGG